MTLIYVTYTKIMIRYLPCFKAISMVANPALPVPPNIPIFFIFCYCVKITMKYDFFTRD